MITYVDTSTLLKLVIEEAGSDLAVAIWNAADDLASVRLVVVEGQAALAAAHRAGRLSDRTHRAAKRNLLVLVADLHLVEVTESLVDSAGLIAESDRLHGYDAVHLAAALATKAEVLTSADSDLCLAAQRHGLHVANPLISAR